jgi:hypothetical protein
MIKTFLVTIGLFALMIAVGIVLITEGSIAVGVILLVVAVGTIISIPFGVKYSKKHPPVDPVKQFHLDAKKERTTNNKSNKNDDMDDLEFDEMNDIWDEMDGE